MIAVLVSSNMKVSPIGYHGVGADREGANTDDGGWGGVEAETAWRELVEPAQVFHDRDASRQQRGVHRACRAAGVVDVDRVDANQCGLPLDQPVGGGSGEEGFLVPYGSGPQYRPQPVWELRRYSAGAHAGRTGQVPRRMAPGVRYPQARAVGWTPLAVSSRRRRADSRRTRSTFADETCRCHWAGRLVLVGLTGAVLAGSGSSRRGAADQRAGARTGRGTPGWLGVGWRHSRGRTRRARRPRCRRRCRRAP